MATFQKSTFDNWWKEVYWPTYTKSWWELSPFLDRLDKRRPGQGYKVSDDGEYILIPIQVSPAQSVGWGTETGALPTPLNPTLDQGYGNTYNFRGAIQLSDKVIAKGANANWMGALDMQMRGIEDMRRARYAFQIYGDGDGALAYSHTASTSATLTSINVPSAFGLHEGMVVDLMDVSATPAAGSGTAADVTLSAISNLSRTDYNTITIASTDVSGWSSAAGMTYGDVIVDANSYKLAMMGLDGIMNTSNPTRGNYFNINRSTSGKEFWHGNAITVGGDLTEDHLAQGVDLMEKLGDQATVILCTQNVRRYLFDELKGERRFDANEGTISGSGAKGVLYWEWGNHGRIDVIADPNCTRISSAGTLYEYCYIVNEDMLYFATINDGEQWLNRDGSVLHLVADASNMYPLWEAGLIEYIELVCPDPRHAGVKLTNISS